MVPQSVIKRVATLILFAGPLTTLAISPWFNFDPINPIKVLVLTCLVSLALGLLVPYLPKVAKRVGKPTNLILALFLVSMISAFSLSEADKFQQFWGVFGRGTGLLSYMSLVLLFFLSNFMASTEFNKRIVFSLLATTTIMVAYCIIQILKLDPVGWSAYFPFGTLGNVNFLSGFMGIALVSVFVLASSPSQPSKLRIALIGLFFLGLFCLYKSDSTQGIVALIVGVATFLLIKSWLINRSVFLVALSLYVSGFIALVAGLFDKGPFREFIYQFTVLFRADYMHAGIEMMIRNPLSGVGIDAYDDWYRTERGAISALRTSFNRTANSAHNISLDLGSGGGFPLLIAYLALIALVVSAILIGVKRGLGRDSFFMAISMSWAAYQVQAAVSINQIGVGVWGWLLGGLIVGSARSQDYSDKSMPLKKVRLATGGKAPNTPPPLAVISSVIVLSVGFLAAYPPLKTDADYLTATKKGSAELVLDVAGRRTTNAFLLSRAVEAAFSAGLTDSAKQILDTLSERFPRNLYSHLVRYENFTNSDSERLLILSKIKAIDPYVAICYEPNPNAIFRKILEGLNPAQSYELARGWGLVTADLKPDKLLWREVSQEALNAKIASFCFSS